MIEEREPIEQIIERATAPDSPYWSFRNLEGVDPMVEQLVEVRIDLDPAVADTFGAPGWSVYRIDPQGMIYLRRRQPLTDEALRPMFAEVLTLAHVHNGQFWSWMHGSALDN